MNLSRPAAPRAIGLDVVGMSKSFGRVAALRDVALKVDAGSFHAILGENGAGKSTLVKCITGFVRPDRGEVRVNGKAIAIGGPRDARRHGIGMVHQSFALVPSLTGAENLIIARADTPRVIRWRTERPRLEAFLERMPFRAPLDAPIYTLSAGEKQKIQILKQLYLDQAFLILDEPSSVLTPDEADELLGRLREMTRVGILSVAMITHKFGEVRAFADEVTVLRRGEVAGAGRVADLTNADIARMMVGEAAAPGGERRRVAVRDWPKTALEIRALAAKRDDGGPAFEDVNLSVRSGEITGIAGVAGNGQAALVEALCGQRAISAGEVLADGERFFPTRANLARHKVFALPEEPLRNAAVGRMSVAENLALRTFDRRPLASRGWLSLAAMSRQARILISRYRIRTPSAAAPIASLSGGNVQRTVLARELSGDVGVLIVANPCAGLDFASVEAIRTEIMEQRNRGAAVLLVSEDLDEILELADVVAVMSGGRIAYKSAVGDTDRTTIGHYMAGDRTERGGVL